jgi:hypothetical protein
MPEPMYLNDDDSALWISIRPVTSVMTDMIEQSHVMNLTACGEMRTNA